MACYDVVLLPIAEDDLFSITTYISEKLHAPQAAEAFVQELDKLVDQLSRHPFSYELYREERPLEYEIRRAPVKSYVIFYAVVENTVEIHRILYGYRDMGKQELRPHT